MQLMLTWVQRSKKGTKEGNQGGLDHGSRGKERDLESSQTRSYETRSWKMTANSLLNTAV